MLPENAPDDGGEPVTLAERAVLATKTRAVLGNATGTSPGAGHVSVALVESLALLFVAPVRDLGAADPERAARTVAASSVAAMQHHLFQGTVPGEDDLDHLVAFLRAGATTA